MAACPRRKKRDMTMVLSGAVAEEEKREKNLSGGDSAIRRRQQQQSRLLPSPSLAKREVCLCTTHFVLRATTVEVDDRMGWWRWGDAFKADERKEESALRRSLCLCPPCCVPRRRSWISGFFRPPLASIPVPAPLAFVGLGNVLISFDRSLTPGS